MNKDIEVRPDSNIATDIREAIKTLNAFIVEAKKRELVVEISTSKNINIGCPEISDPKITKPL